MENEQDLILEQVSPEASDLPSSPASAQPDCKDEEEEENESNQDDDDGDSINDEDGSSHRSGLNAREKGTNSDEASMNGNCKMFEFPSQNSSERKSLEASLEGELDFEDEVHEKEELSKDEFSNEGQASNEQQEERDSDCIDEKEEGAVDDETKPQKNKEIDENSEAQSMEEGEDDGELSDQDEQDDDLEEGEVKDTTPTSKQPTRQICRFFNRGQCTWGTSCRFLHLSANDKGNYCMFSPTRIPPPPFGLGPPPGLGMVPHMGQRRNGPDFLPPPPLPPPPPPPPPAVEPSPSESAWERGLRHAKELMKKASRRKEQEPDFEEKRLNLSIDENDRISAEYDKENEFFGKSPYRRQSDIYGRYEEGNEVYDNGDREAREHWRGGRYENFEIRWTRQDGQNKDRRDKDKSRSTRLSAEREKPNKNTRGKERWRDDRLSEIQTSRTRGDEWRDPWRRSKTPKGRRSRSRGRSRGSFSSVSSRSYSDRSSHSSYSYSRSSSRSSCYSSASGSPKRPAAPQRKLPYNRKIPSPPPKPASRPLPYKRRPPPSRSRSGSYSRSHSSRSVSHSRSSSSRSQSASKSPSPSRSRSYSRSLSMSSVSSASSSISHSSSGSEAPLPRQPEVRVPPPRAAPQRALVPKKEKPFVEVKPLTIPKPAAKSSAPNFLNEMERLIQYDKLRDNNKTSAAGVKVGSAAPASSREKKPVIDDPVRPDSYSSSAAEKLKDPSKQKQPIKLTLLNKASSLSKRDLEANKLKAIEKDDATRGASKVSATGTKRPLSPTSSGSKMAPAPAPKRSTSSRRDELLKQLKAVEDAIARKRAKFS